MLQHCWPAFAVADNESALLERVQPVRHRPPAPPLIEDRGVTHDVVQMFYRGIRHGMELMKSMCAPDPSHRNARGARGLREVGVLGAISAVAVIKATDTSPCRSGQGERQRRVAASAVPGEMGR